MVSDREAAMLPLRHHHHHDIVQKPDSEIERPENRETGLAWDDIVGADSGVVDVDGVLPLVSPFIFTSPSNPLMVYSKQQVCDANGDEGDEEKEEKNMNIVNPGNGNNDNNDHEIVTTADVMLSSEKKHNHQTKATKQSKVPLSEAMVEVMLDYSALFDQMQEVLEEGSHEEKGDQLRKNKAHRVMSAGKSLTLTPYSSHHIIIPTNI